MRDQELDASPTEAVIPEAAPEAMPEPSDAPAPEEPAAPVLRVSATVTLESNVFEPTRNEKVEPLYMVRVTLDELNKAAEAYPNINPASSEEGRNWVKAVSEALPLVLRGDVHLGSLKREGSDWRQSVDHEGLRLGAGKPMFGNSNDPTQRLTGERAIMRIQGLLGLGSVVQVPLWHTGIWVTIKAPSDGALLNLERIIAEDKITLGRDANGMIYSNASVYLNNHLFNFVVEHIYDTTLRDYSPEKFRSLVRSTDFPTLIWGLACAIYPTGYPVAQPCTLNPDVCQEVTSEHVMLPKLNWVDRQALTAHQKRHMANRNAKYTTEEIQKYMSEGRMADARPVDLTPNLRFALQVPTIEQYVESGDRWVTEIIDMVSTAMGSTLDEKNKDRFIMEHSRLSTLRQYAHWVKRIVLLNEQGEEDGVVDDRETIEATLNTISTDDEIVTKFLEAVKIYIDDSTVQMIALPSFNCPKCQAPMVDEERKHPLLIPLEPNMLFFTLRGRRLSRAKTH